MNLVGQRVTHIMPNGKPGKYGVGTIADSRKDGKYITVKFDTEHDSKTFVFPECFGRYLSLQNPELAKQVESFQEAYSLAKAKCQERHRVNNMIPKPMESTNSLLDELDHMIGLDAVKADVHRLTAFIQVNNMRRARSMKAVNISKHLVFTGKPGTGKTTMARMIARLYYSIGAIRCNKLVEASRATLVAGYVGQTAIKTQEMINSALGGVLFIDEAYSLANDTKSENGYGREAIDTLLSAMENHRDNLVVIVAGYEDRMKSFIDSNPGLASRFNRYIHFEDYDPADLMAIFLHLCDENEYILQGEANACVEEYLRDAYEHRSDDFGNARFVRNLFELIIAYQAERIFILNEVGDEMLIEITVSDVENAIHHAAMHYIR